MQDRKCFLSGTCVIFRHKWFCVQWVQHWLVMSDAANKFLSAKLRDRLDRRAQQALVLLFELDHNEGTVIACLAGRVCISTKQKNAAAQQ